MIVTLLLIDDNLNMAMLSYCCSHYCCFCFVSLMSSSHDDHHPSELTLMTCLVQGLAFGPLANPMSSSVFSYLGNTFFLTASLLQNKHH